MPKMKTRRGAAKRFKKTGSRQAQTGQGVPERTCSSSKTSTQKRNLRNGGLVDGADERAIKQQLPYL